MYHLWTNHDKLISEKEVEVENAPEAISEFQARSPSLYAASAPVPPLSQKSTPERPELLLVLSSQSLGFRKTHVALSENTPKIPWFIIIFPIIVLFKWQFGDGSKPWHLVNIKIAGK